MLFNCLVDALPYYYDTFFHLAPRNGRGKGQGCNLCVRVSWCQRDEATTSYTWGGMGIRRNKIFTFTEVGGRPSVDGGSCKLRSLQTAVVETSLVPRPATVLRATVAKSAVPAAPVR